MAILTTTLDTADPEIKRMVNETIKKATAEFSPLAYEGAYPRNGFGMAILRPRTVGIGNDYWQMTVTASFADWINHTLDQSEFVVVTGIMNLTADPATTQIWPKANGQDLPVVSIEELYALEKSRGWFEEPFAVSPNNNITVQAVGRIAQTERLGLMGYHIAKRSYLIDTTP